MSATPSPQAPAVEVKVVHPGTKSRERARLAREAREFFEAKRVRVTVTEVAGPHRVVTGEEEE